MEFKTPQKSFQVGLDQSDLSKFKIASSVSNAGVNTFGKQTQGATTDADNSGSMSCSKYTSGASGGTLSSLSVYIANLQGGTSYQMALYDDTGSGGFPGNLITNS